MPHILFACPSLRNLLRRRPIIEALLSQGHTVAALYEPERGEEGIEVLVNQGVRLLPLGLTRGGKNLLQDFRRVKHLAAIIRREQPNLVHTFTVKPNIFVTEAAARYGKSAIVNSVTGLGSVHVAADSSLKARMQVGIIDFLYKKAMSHSDRVIFQNKFDLEYFLENGRVKEHQVKMIRGSGVDPQRFHPSLKHKSGNRMRQELGVDESDIIITSVTRLIKDKGIRELVAAAKKIVRDHEKVKFLVVGDSDRNNPTAVSQHDLGLDGHDSHIRFLGDRGDIPELLSATDIFCLPSYREGLPGAVLEAMAMGLPIVTTDAPGCSETVENGYNGFLVPVRNEPLLTSALEKLIVDASLRESMGQRSRLRVEEEFSDQRVVEQHLHLYQELLG